MFEGLASFNSLLLRAMKHFPIDEGSWDKLTECLALWNFWLEWIRFSFSSKNFYNIFICLLFKFLWPSFKSVKVCCKLADFFPFGVGCSRWEGTSQSVLSLSNNHTFFFIVLKHFFQKSRTWLSFRLCSPIFKQLLCPMFVFYFFFCYNEITWAGELKINFIYATPLVPTEHLTRT